MISRRVCRLPLSGSAWSQQTTISCVPELAGVFILHGVTCHSFRRDCLFSHSAHSALFINTQTQEVLFIRQSDRDQLGVRRMPAQRGDCVKRLRMYLEGVGVGGLRSAKQLVSVRNI